MNPWSPRFAVLRTYSLALYKSPGDAEPSSYITLEDVRDIKIEEEEFTHRGYSFSIQTNAEIFYFSLDYPESLSSFLTSESTEPIKPAVDGSSSKSSLRPQQQEEIARELRSWVFQLQALAFCNLMSRYKK